MFGKKRPALNRLRYQKRNRARPLDWWADGQGERRYAAYSIRSGDCAAGACPGDRCSCASERSAGAHARRCGLLRGAGGQLAGVQPLVRSDEHTSELQSLMRTSYAVFCLKNKNLKLPTVIPHQHFNTTSI